jgi:hypothetical protein
MYAQRVILTLALLAEVLSLVQWVFLKKWAKIEQKQNITSQLALEETLWVVDQTDSPSTISICALTSSAVKRCISFFAVAAIPERSAPALELLI